MPNDWKREKNWKQMYTRSEKVARARQLGFEYPLASEAAQTEAAIAEPDGRMNVLFVCSRNQWRSPTAEKVWRKHPGLAVRSAGTSPNARHPVTEQDLRWADAILVMEDKHRSRLVAEFGRIVEGKPIHVLDIPDQYRYMDPELVEELTHAVRAVLGLD
jgi:predicted protein tyrosine phosphatase